MLIWEKDATPKMLAELKRRGISPVMVNDGEFRHAPDRKAHKHLYDDIKEASEREADEDAKD